MTVALQPLCLSIKDAAKYISLSPSFLKAEIRKGRLKAYRPGDTRKWVIEVKDLESWWEASKEEVR